MLVKINGVPMMEAPTVETFTPLPTNSILLNTIPTFNFEQVGDKLIDIGQNLLVVTGEVFIVVVGIMMIVGLKREGWKRISSVLQGLGVGLIGPTAVVLFAGFCLGIANLLN